MAKFVLTAQLQLQGPTNTRQVINDLRRQLQGGINIPIEVRGSSEARRQIEQVERQTKSATSAADAMGKSFGLAFKRFAAFTVASRTVSLFTNALANAVDEAIDFQREMIKIAQVTRAADDDLRKLEKTIFKLAKTLGVSSQELLQVTRILSQAGIQAKELDIALTALAKTTLAPTFEDISQTAEGAIAIIAQFKQGVGALEQQLGSINAVAGQFAVESGDLIGAIRRTGGVFKEAGGSLEEFIGLFTSVRATTRESSESIATGLRTIFTRIQRPKTIEFLRQYGVELTDLEGKFVGPFEAVRRLNEALSGLEQGDIRFVRIAEELGGFRQIGKVIPLLKEFELAERARQAAVDGGNSLTEDAIKAQESLAIQFLKVRQEFQELIQSIANSTTFQAFAKTALKLASALISVADAIKPILPLLGALAAFKAAKGLSAFAGGFGSAIRGAASFDPQRRKGGGKILAFARGGFVPGTGNRDTVPAMLSPGEFVVKKSSAAKLGAQTLHAMNNNRYARGGTVNVEMKPNYGIASIEPGDGASVRKAGGVDLTSSLNKPLDDAIKPFLRNRGSEPQPEYVPSGNKTQQRSAKAIISKLGKVQNVTDPIASSDSTTVDNLSSLLGKTKAWVRGTEKGQKRKTPLTYRDAREQLIKQGLIVKPSAEDTQPAKANIITSGPLPSVVFRPELLGGEGGGLIPEMQQIVRDGMAGIIASVTSSNTFNRVGIAGTPLAPDAEAMKSAVNNLINEDPKSARTTIEGYVLEGLISSIGGMELQGSDANLDFLAPAPSNPEGIDDIFGKGAAEIMTRLKGFDAKRTMSAKSVTSILGKKFPKVAEASDIANAVFAANKGGTAPNSGTDTVPALLTPGEFVINKGAAQSIGYGNLNSMNKTGVARFAEGGAVGVQRFADGGNVPKVVTEYGDVEAYQKAMKAAADAAELTAKFTAKINDADKDILSAKENFASEANKLREIQEELATIAEGRVQYESMISAAVAKEAQLKAQKESARQEASVSEAKVGDLEFNKGVEGRRREAAVQSNQTAMAGAQAQQQSATQRRNVLLDAAAQKATQMGGQDGPKTSSQKKAAAEFAILQRAVDEQEKAIETSIMEQLELEQSLKDINKKYDEMEKVFDESIKAAKEKAQADRDAADDITNQYKKAKSDTRGARQNAADYEGRMGTADVQARYDAQASVTQAAQDDVNNAEQKKSTLEGARDRASNVRESAEGRVKGITDQAVASGKAAKEQAAAAKLSAQRMKMLAAGTGVALTALNAVAPSIDSLTEESSLFQKALAYSADAANKAVAWLGSLGYAAQALGIQLNKEALMSSARQAKQALSGGFDFLKTGFNPKGKGAGNTKVGQAITGGVTKGLQGLATGLKGVGGKLTGFGARLASSGGMLARLAPIFTATGAAAGGMGAAATAAIAPLAAVAAPALAVVGALAAIVAIAYGLAKAFDWLSGHAAEYDKAVQDGNMEKATEMAVMKQNQKAMNNVVLASTAAGAAIGSFVPGIGTAIGAIIGAAVGLGAKLISLAPRILSGLVSGLGSVIGKTVDFFGKLIYSIPLVGDAIAFLVNIIRAAGKFVYDGFNNYIITPLTTVFNAIKAFGASIYNFAKNIPGVGLVISGLEAIGSGIADAVAGAGEVLSSVFSRDGIGQLFGMDTSATVQAQARAMAAMDIYTKNVEKNAKAQQDLLNDIESGEIDLSFGDALKEGDLTKNLTNALRARNEASASSEATLTERRNEAGSIFDSEEERAEKTKIDFDKQTFARKRDDKGRLETEEEYSKRLTDMGLDEKQVKQQVESDKTARNEIQAAKPILQRAAKQTALEGGLEGTKNFDDFMASLDPALAEEAMRDPAVMDELKKIYETQSKAVQENLKYIDALNFGLRDATGAATAMAATMDNIAASQEAGFNSFAASATTLENAMTAAGKNISDSQMDAAIADLESSMRSYGATDEQISESTGTIRGIQQVQKNTDSALDATKAILSENADTDPETIKKTLGDELLKGIDDPETNDRLQAAIDKLDLSAESGNLEKIQAGKLDEVLKATLDPVAEAVTKEAIELAKRRGEAENKIIDATKKRIAQEEEYIAAQKSAIDTQLEAGKLFEEFGGAKLTSDQKLSARSAQANLDLQNAGVGGLQGGGADDIRRALAETKTKFTAQQDAVNFGTLGIARGATDPATGKAIGPAFAGAAGVDEDKRDELKQANKALVEFTKQRISLIQEELRIAEQKNKAEKDSLDKLLGGDIEGFLAGQEAAAAAQALKTGDASLAGAFSASALGAGYKTLEGQGLSDSEMQRAASLSLSSVGVTDPRSAQVLAGTTDEQSALKAEGRELAQVLGEGAQDGADLEGMEVSAANVVIEAQKITLNGIEQQAQDQANQQPGDIAAMWRGGPVYANRGMFVPRGTDTVPAMLTPGEFVVNRAAVQRGNNLALLKAMNGGVGAAGMGMAMSRGGMVYAAGGGLLEKVYAAQRSAVGGVADMMGVGQIGQQITDGMKTVQDGFMNNVVDPLKKVFDNSPMGMFATQFQESVQKLMDFQLNVKVDPTNVNVNFNGASVLQGLSDSIKKELLEKVREELKNGKFNESGEFTSKPGM